MRSIFWKAVPATSILLCGITYQAVLAQQPTTKPGNQATIIDAAEVSETGSGPAVDPATTAGATATTSSSANTAVPMGRNAVVKELAAMKARIAELEAALKARSSADDATDAEKDAGDLRTAEADAVGGQAPATQTAPAPATPTEPAAAPAAPTWSVGPMEVSGLIDGYYSANFNRPSANALGDQLNQLYNFNDKTDQFELGAAKLTLNHDPDPIGARIDFLYGRTNTVFNSAPSNSTSADQLNYIEQAFLSVKPPKAKGFEFDFGKFVTSAGAEVAEAKDNWNYSRSLLFVYAIPYWHFGARASIPVSKTDTVGFQLVNGWNNVSKSNGGLTGAFTNAYTKPKYAWNLNYIIGPENPKTTTGLRNLFDTTLLLTPPGKYNAYFNFDYGQNTDAAVAQGDTKTHEWWGAAGALHAQATAKSAIALRAEYFSDPDGFQTGTGQHVYEGTFTYEYKWVEGALMRLEYRADASNVNFFAKQTNASLTKGATSQQQTLTVAFIAFFGPKR